MSVIRIRQRGSALIVAMLVAALVAILAVQLAQAFVVNASLAESRLLQQRFETYLRGAEELALAALQQDWQHDSMSAEGVVDHAGESWALELPPLPTDDGMLQVSIVDAQGLFNINNLRVRTAYHDDNGAPPAQRFSAPQRQFIRLLKSIESLALSDSEAMAVTEAITDWIDSDDQVSGMGGAESLFYQNAGTGLQAANQPLSDLSELLLVRHVTPELLVQLRQRAVALPGLTSLNVNTATPLVLRALNDEQQLQAADEEDVLAILDLRARQPWLQVAEFMTAGFPADPQGPLAMIGAEDADTEQDATPLYSVFSQYFLASVRVMIDDQERQMQSLIYRDDNGVYALARYNGDIR
ncbi:type II secretion system minor pseudopilin GspK [Pseudohongiella spirulinae]|uniref:Type II secretion system protein K n=1 Tax=Pseudohongiella spirulinae TaxID=1249552 RepID=A0A0S2KFD2_9GAMM|nr:type II secretion system minor pseudopilin GspK [Pseudohongiella spirulinae]ALO47025.1 hypothetical protein PS2015_2391 [Pseudohongiella spirulinae]